VAASSRPLTERELVADLRDIGVPVRSVWDLVNTDQPYDQALPVLVSWLRRLRDVDTGQREYRAVYEGVVRALGVKKARPLAARPLVEEFWRIDDNSIRWTIGNTLDLLADQSMVDDLLNIVREPRFGASRQMVVRALGRVGKGRPEVVETLVGLLADDDLTLHATDALARLGATDARQRVQELLHDNRAAVQRAARSAIRTFDRLESRSAE
jgi:HEAT repeat protein